MTLQEQIEKLNDEYLSADGRRDPYYIINDCLNLLNKQSEALKVAKEVLEELITNHGFYTEERFILVKQALATIEEMEQGK